MRQTITAEDLERFEVELAETGNPQDLRAVCKGCRASFIGNVSRLIDWQKGHVGSCQAIRIVRCKRRLDSEPPTWVLVFMCPHCGCATSLAAPITRDPNDNLICAVCQHTFDPSRRQD